MTQRTREERIQETRMIVNKLNELNLTVIYSPIAKLFNQMKKYINDGERQDVDIKIYECDKKIIGSLEIDKTNKCILKITNI